MSFSSTSERDSLNLVLNRSQRRWVVSNGQIGLLTYTLLKNHSSALEHGAQLVPVYSFNENGTYRLYQGGNKFLNEFREHFKNMFGLTLPLVLNIVPRRTKITLVVGQPIEMPFIKEPSPEEVDMHHSLYIEKLKELYDTHKHKYNEPKNKELVII